MKEKSKAIILMLFVLGVFGYGLLHLVSYIFRGVF